MLVLATVLFRHVRQQDPVELLEALPENIDLALQDLHYTQNENGQRRWTLNADKAEYAKDSTQVNLDKVDLIFYDAGQFDELRLQSEQGTLDQASRQIDVWGNVELSSDRGDLLLTDRLHYDDQLRQISTDDDIRYHSVQMQLTGRGLQVDIDQGRLLVRENVRVLLTPGKGESQ